MNTEKLFDAMNDIKEEYKTEALIRNGYLSDTETSVKEMSEMSEISKQLKTTAKKGSRRVLTIALAACLVLALAITAYAIGVFSLSHRDPEPGETYSLYWPDNPSGRLVWDKFNYVFEFDGPDECAEIKFKEGWLPFRPNEEVNSWSTDEEGWRSTLVSEGAEGVDHTSENYQPYRVDTYYASMFKNDGAMILMYHTPEKIINEQWGEHQVLKFHATQHFDAIDNDETGIHRPERVLDYYYVMLFSPDDGYVIVVSGTSDMETIEHVARELQIKKTGNMLSADDFEQNCVFIDVGQG